MEKNTMIDAEDIRSWAAYSRNRRRLQRERWMVSIVTLALLGGVTFVAVCYVIKERALACERAKIQAVLKWLEPGGKNEN